jgi:cobalamin biosynthesis protein CobD
MSFEPSCAATAIGSLPHKDPEQACKVVLESIPNGPIWPQLPANGLHEQMEIQYSEGIPRVVLDQVKGRMYFDTTGDTSTDLADFYEKYCADDLEAFRISPDFSKGIYAMESALKASGVKRPFVKVRTTGPLSVGLSIVDENKRAIYYNPEFVDVVVKGMAMKCRWQIRKFQPFAEKVICFVDEPILSAFGSSTYVSVTRDDTVAKLGEVIEAVHSEGALAGVHCCGNTEWPILMDAGVDIINFDAFDYGETILLHPDAFESHLKAGKGLVSDREASALAQARWPWRRSSAFSGADRALVWWDRRAGLRVCPLESLDRPGCPSFSALLSFGAARPVAARLAVERAVRQGDLPEGRRRIAQLVGRDTDRMDLAACRRAAIESLSENLVDGVVTPIFWYTVAGLPGVVLFKVVSTMDSMVGYKTPLYLRFGWCGARLDDVMNWLPARIDWLLTAFCALLLPGCSGSKALRVGWQQHALMPGPNSGWSEAATAGAIQRRLVGHIWRQGQLVTELWLGEASDPPAGDDTDVQRTAILLTVTGLSATALALFAIAAIH